MKPILLILFPYLLSAQIKWTDYDSHYHVSGSIASLTGSAMYIATKKPVLSAFLGCVTALSIGMAKEYVWDKRLGRGQFSGYDIEANVKGCLFFSFATAITLHRIEEKKHKVICLTNPLAF